MVRIVISTVEVITPDGTESLWAVALPHSEAVAAVSKVIPPDHIAELSILRSLQSSAKLKSLRPGEVRKIGVLTKPNRKIRPSIAKSINGRPKREPQVSNRAVSDYRAYALGRDGRILAFKEFRCLDDREAIAEAKRLTRKFDIEVWNGDRFVLRLAHRPD
jgi:hypothetical protein